MKSVAVFALLLVAAAAPTVQAHAAPTPPSWMTRMLHDFNDDWGSDSTQGSPQDGHDIIALDLREAYNTTLGKDTLVLRLSLNFGYDGDATKPELREVITFKAKGQSVSREFRTTDNKALTGNFDAIYGPVPLLTPEGKNDNTRFYVEGIIAYDTLDLRPGDKIGEFFVQGYGGGNQSDHMVGGYTLRGETNNNEPPSEVSTPASYRRNEYTLRGPVMYAKSSLDLSQVAAKPGENKTLTWSVTNDLSVKQTMTLRTEAPENVVVGLHGAGYSTEKLTLELQPGGSATVHAYVTPEAGAASGPIDFLLLTDLGGRVVQPVGFTVGDAPPPDGGGLGGAPATASWTALLVLAACVALARRSR